MPATNEKPERVRILVADSAELVRRGIRGVLGRDRRFVVIGEIARPQDLAKAYLELSPDVIFLGLERDNEQCPGQSESLEALRETLRLDPLASVIVLVDGETVHDLLEPVQAGASGVVMRGAPASALLDAVHHVLAGGSALDPQLTRRLFGYLASEAVLSSVSPELRLDPAALRSLSPREQQVLRSLCQGHRNREIAARLGVTVGTVKTHLRHIFRKLRVYDRTGAILTALQVPRVEAA